MAVNYVDANRQDTGFLLVPTNKQNLADLIETTLLAAGWSTISGHGALPLVMESGTTPQGLKGRIRIKDNAGTCITISIENSGGTVTFTNSTTAGLMLNPGSSSKHYRIIANAYQAFIWTGSPTPAREFVAFGVPFIPSFLVGIIYEAMWGTSNAYTDTDTTVRDSWRTRIINYLPGTAVGANQMAFCNGNKLEIANGAGVGTTSGIGDCAIGLVPSNNPVDTGAGRRDILWHDSSPNLTDALVSWGFNPVAGVTAALIRGYLWDSIVSTGTHAGDATTSLDSHNWIVITDNSSGVNNSCAAGTLLIVKA